MIKLYFNDQLTVSLFEYENKIKVSQNSSLTTDKSGYV